jgi:hypothetical protein
MIRIIAKVFAVTVVLTAFLSVAPLFAAPVTYIANGGSGTACTSAAPCGSLSNALSVDNGGQITCLDPNTTSELSTIFAISVTIDCAGLNLASPSGAVGLVLDGTNQVVKIRNLTMSGIFVGSSAIQVTGSGTLILENCVLENFSGTALDIEPTGAFNLVITNSRISSSAAGVLLQPGSGGSINATLDHVVITGNSGTGGGIKSNSADGIVNLDITESEVSYNGGVGVNGRSGGFLNMVSIKNSVITKNGAQGVQANGANVGITVQTTLLDQNTGGATSIEAGGHISTYGNNSIIGPSGSGFTGTASLQ